MNEEIEYAEMLEIPVSTVNVVRKRRKLKRAPSLQQSLIDQVNERLTPQEEGVETPAPEELPALEEPLSVPESQDFSTTTVEEGEQTLPEAPRSRFLKRLLADPQDEHKPSKASKIVYRVEIACACILCLGIFLTNVFLPGSAINTFFRTMTTTPTQEESLVFSDFALSPIVGEYSTATVSVSPEGVVSLTAEGCIYPAVDGKVVDVRNADGAYTVTLEHSPSFTSVISGLSHVYYEIGNEVKHNVPVGFSKGDREVQMTMYSQGELLDCLQIEGQNCLAWVEASE